MTRFLMLLAALALFATTAIVGCPTGDDDDSAHGHDDDDSAHE